MAEQETIPLVKHLEIVRDCDKQLGDERDRRYSEVNAEKEKALAIKEKADEAALRLARDQQTYKDEKANELREQINTERVLYATKDDLANIVDRIDAAIKPISEYISLQRGASSGKEDAIERQQAKLNQRLTIYGVIIAIIVVLVNLLPLIFGV